MIRNRLPSLTLVLAIGTGSLSARAQSAPVAPVAPVSPTPAPALKAEASTTPDAEASLFKSRIEHELGIAGGLTSADVARRAVATSYSLEARRA